MLALGRARCYLGVAIGTRQVGPLPGCDHGRRTIGESPDRLSRKYAYQILLIEECGTWLLKGRSRWCVTWLWESFTAKGPIADRYVYAGVGSVIDIP